jgi:hypothetical protein
VTPHFTDSEEVGYSQAAAVWSRRLSLLLLVLILPSCALPIHSGASTTHYVIVGFGVVSVHENARDAIVATDTQDLGVVIGDRPNLRMSVGYLSSSVVSVADGAQDVRVEASRRPFGPFVVETVSAKLGQPAKGTR